MKLALVTALFVAALSPTGRAFAEAPAVLVILDGSGSMWGQVEGRPKIEIAREVIESVLESLPADIAMGLLTYGHRRKGDCGDIELVAPVGSSRSELRAAVDRISPKGKTPLTDAIQRSVDVLRSHEGESTVVVVSDGKESCGGDPCAATASAIASGVRLRVHVVGFDVTEEEAAELQCIAEEGGGRYFSAETSAELGKALTEVQREVVATPPPPTPTEAPPSPTPTEAPSGPGRVTLEAVYAEGGEVVSSGVGWTIHRAEVDLEGRRERVEQTGADRPTVKLEPGRYLVEVRRGDTSASQEIEVAPGEEVTVQVSLEAGILRARALPSEGAKPLDRGVGWRVYEADAGLAGERKRVASTGADQPTLTLPAGRYLVTARWGDAEASREVDVVAGEAASVDVVLEAGVLRPTATLSEGGPVVDGVGWTVYEGELDLDGGRVKVTGTGANEPTLRLPAGKYQLEVHRGEARATSEVEIVAGKATTPTLALDAGVLGIVAVDSGGKEIDRGLGWVVLEAEAGIDGERRKVTSTGAPKPSLTLPAGRYLVRAHGSAGTGEGEVAVEAGLSRSLEVVVTKSPEVE